MSESSTTIATTAAPFVPTAPAPHEPQPPRDTRTRAYPLILDPAMRVRVLEQIEQYHTLLKSMLSITESSAMKLTRAVVETMPDSDRASFARTMAATLRADRTEAEALWKPNAERVFAWRADHPVPWLDIDQELFERYDAATAAAAGAGLASAACAEARRLAHRLLHGWMTRGRISVERDAQTLGLPVYVSDNAGMSIGRITSGNAQGLTLDLKTLHGTAPFQLRDANGLYLEGAWLPGRTPGFGLHTRVVKVIVVPRDNSMRVLLKMFNTQQGLKNHLDRLTSARVSTMSAEVPHYIRHHHRRRLLAIEAAAGVQLQKPSSDGGADLPSQGAEEPSAG